MKAFKGMGKMWDSPFTQQEIKSLKTDGETKTEKKRPGEDMNESDKKKKKNGKPEVVQEPVVEQKKPTSPSLDEPVDLFAEYQAAQLEDKAQEERQLVIKPVKSKPDKEKVPVKAEKPVKVEKSEKQGNREVKTEKPKKKEEDVLIKPILQKKKKSSKPGLSQNGKPEKKLVKFSETNQIHPIPSRYGKGKEK
jgi:hypothetical protein